MRMESKREYVDRAKAATNTDTDSNMARKIGITRQYMSRFVKDQTDFSDDVMLRLAARADLDPDEALILANFWRAHGETKKRYAAIYKKFTGAVTCIFIIFSLSLAPLPNSLINKAEARAFHMVDHTDEVRDLMIMR